MQSPRVMQLNHENRCLRHRFFPSAGDPPCRQVYGGPPRGGRYLAAGEGQAAATEGGSIWSRSRSRMPRSRRETCIWLTPIAAPISAWVCPSTKRSSRILRSRGSEVGQRGLEHRDRFGPLEVDVFVVRDRLGQAGGGLTVERAVQREDGETAVRGERGLDLGNLVPSRSASSARVGRGADPAPAAAARRRYCPAVPAAGAGSGPSTNNRGSSVSPRRGSSVRRRRGTAYRSRDGNCGRP